MEIQARPFAEVMDETYCPEDQAIGCESCTGEEECQQRAHEEFKCFDDCPICEKINDQKENEND